LASSKRIGDLSALGLIMTDNTEVELFGIEINDQRILYVEKDEELVHFSHLLLPGSFGFIYKRKVLVGYLYRYGVHWLRNLTWLSVPKQKEEEVQK